MTNFFSQSTILFLSVVLVADPVFSGTCNHTDGNTFGAEALAPESYGSQRAAYLSPRHRWAVILTMGAVFFGHAMQAQTKLTFTKSTEAQRLNLLDWVRADEQPDTSAAWQTARKSAKALQDPAWAAETNQFFSHHHQWVLTFAHPPTGPGAMESFRKYLNELGVYGQAFNVMLRSHGWVAKVDVGNKPLLFGRIINGFSVKIVPDGDVASMPVTVPVVRAEPINLVSGNRAIDVSGTVLNTMNAGSNAMIVEWKPTFDSVLAEIQGIANPHSLFQQRLAGHKDSLRYAELYRKALQDEGLLTGTILTPSVATRIEHLLILHEAGHVLKNEEHGIGMDRDEIYMYLTELLAPGGRIRLVQLSYMASKDPGGPAAAILGHLATLLGNNNPLKGFLKPTFSDYLSVDDALLALPDQPYRALVIQSRNEVGRTLHGPSLWHVLFPDGSRVSVQTTVPKASLEIPFGMPNYRPVLRQAA